MKFGGLLFIDYPMYENWGLVAQLFSVACAMVLGEPVTAEFCKYFCTVFVIMCVLHRVHKVGFFNVQSHVLWSAAS